MEKLIRIPELMPIETINKKNKLTVSHENDTCVKIENHFSRLKTKSERGNEIMVIHISIAPLKFAAVAVAAVYVSFFFFWNSTGPFENHVHYFIAYFT